VGKSSKPLTIHVDQALHTGAREQFDSLEAKGHTITVIGQEAPPDIVVAPYAFRLTADMLKQLPTQALDLVIKGVRALRYAPRSEHGTEWKTGKGKGKRVPHTKTNPGQDPPQQTEIPLG